MPGYTGEILITSAWDGKGVAAAQAQLRGLESTVRSNQARMTTLGQGPATAAKGGMTDWIRKNQLGLRMVGHDAQMVGQTIFRWVTIPLGLVSVVTAKMAYDFNTSMTKVQALTGTSTEMMKTYNEEVLRLSKATGVMPTAVSEGLYFIASSGFKGASALKILAESTKLAATGMGDMMFMGQTLTSAMTAWGEKTLSAAEAADTLVAAVREGKAEPDEFSRSLGRVIPVASQVGIKFQEVAASIAAMTNIGLSARISTFALRTLLTSFLKPQKPLIDGLKEVGLTVPKIVKTMTTDGFLPAMKKIYDATHGSATKITRMFTQNAGTAFLALFRQYDKTKGIFDRTIGSQGDAAKAFALAMESPAAKFRVALANLSAAAIVLGSKLLPIFTQIVSWVSRLVDKFNNLSSSTQGWIGKILIAVSAIGILASVVGKVATIMTGVAAFKFMVQGGFSGTGMIAEQARVAREAAAGGAEVANTGATNANTAAKNANAAATIRQIAVKNGLITANITEATTLTAGEAAFYSAQVAREAAVARTEAATADLMLTEGRLVMAQGAVVTTTAAETDALNAYIAAQARAAVVAAEASAAQTNLATSTVLLEGTQTRQSASYIAGLRAQVAATAMLAADANAVAVEQGAAAMTASRVQAMAKGNLVAAEANAARSATGVATAATAAGAAITLEKTAIDTLAASSKKGLTGTIASVASWLGPWKAAGLVIAAIGAALLVIKLNADAAMNAIATPDMMKSTKAAIEGPDGRQLQEWADRALGGRLVVKDGELVWQPRYSVKPIDVSTLSKWAHTTAVEARRKLVEADIEEQRVYAKVSAREAMRVAKEAELGIGFIKSQKAYAGRLGPEAQANAKAQLANLEYTARTQRALYDELVGKAEGLAGRLARAQGKTEVLVIKAKLVDMGDSVKKFEGQLSKVRASMKKATPGSDLYLRLQMNEQEILDKLARLRSSIQQLRKENKPILLEARVESAKKNVKTLQQLVTRLKARDARNNLPFQADTKAAMAKLKALREQRDKLKEKLEIEVGVKGPRKTALGLPNWIREGSGTPTKTATVQIAANAGDVFKKARTVTNALAIVGGLTPTPKIGADIGGVTNGVTNARIALDAINGKTVTTYINEVTRPRDQAFGGVYNLTSATNFRAGEAGPEVAAFFPLNNPTRSSSLLAQLNAQFGATGNMPGSGGGSRTVHYHSHVTLPQGIVVDDTERFAKRLTPYQASQLSVAQRRRQRGVATL